MVSPDLDVPFRQFIVKVHSRCNLSCEYCYVYHHVDQSWRDRPMVMSRHTVDALSRRIGDHAARHHLPNLVVVLHGGEPLLAGAEAIDEIISTIRARVPADTMVDVTLQTNGTLVAEPFIDVFRRHDVGVGVSLDGGRPAHNSRRVYPDGRPSFSLVERGLDRLRRERDIWTGILCAIDLANDPIQVYEDLVALGPPQIDLLLPLANWVHLPPDHDPDETPYAKWLIAVFDRWFSAPRRETGIRLFESIIALLLGMQSETEAIGLDSADAITIETDGSLESTDALKTTAPGLGALGLSVHRNSFDEAMRHPAVRATRRTIDRLSAECRSCPIVEVCGGGQYSHRYGPDGGFVHRSVYCHDLIRLITYIDGRLHAELFRDGAAA